MVNLFDIKKIISQRPAEQKDVPKHILLNLFPSDDFQKVLDLMFDMVDLQTEKNIPIVTIAIGKKEDIDEKILFKSIELLEKKALDLKIKVTVIGKWYEMQGQLVEALKKINNETAEFDHFFLNICINYNPKEEIVDACRVIMRKILMEKTDIDSITPDLIKENIYSSFLMPPDIVIEPSLEFSGTFLWDSPGSEVINLNKPVSEITKQDILKLI